ncbi:MAG: ribonuclease [Rhodobacterales bacterium]|nr:MAG: ribonuclease [Rhodobacterales bacterium]
MAKKMLIDATHAEETRVVVVDGNKVEEFDFETQSRKQLAGNIYLAKVMRVEPSLQAAFVDYGGNRHGFLAFNEIHPDYYQIPVADREALLAEEQAYADSLSAEADEEETPKPKRRRSRSRSKAEKTRSDDAVVTKPSEDIAGMETIEPAEGDPRGDDAEADAAPLEAAEGASPAAETPEETPTTDAPQDAASAEDQPETEAAASTEAGDTEEAAPQESGEEAAAQDTQDETSAPDAANDAAEEPQDDGDAPQADPADDEGDKPKARDASAKDDGIESVAHEDESEDIRPRRKPRPKRYKIQEVVKVRQVMLVQVVKEERGNKGAALTTYLSLAGRYCVLMPNTARGGGISRKITNASDRKKLKEIATSLDVPKGAGLIIRTAGSQRTKSEIKRDYEYLQRLWEQVRELTLKSIAPAPIYEEGNLIKRSIRDYYSKEIDEVIVEGDAGYRVAKDFMKMIMPSHAKNVKHYTDQMPLYARYQVETTLSAMFNPTVQLPSGGYIVIGITEALVAVDVNSGRATKEGSIEQTALKTNLEAAEEVARQARLRDLAGLIVIDFIDMDERKNNAAVEKRLKDKLKTDRARIQVGKISGFGLLEMSRQRLRPGMLEATTQPCPHCHGTGLLRSDDNVALSILRALEEEGVRGRSREVKVTAPVAVANYLMNQKREHIAQIEARYGMSVRIEASVDMVSPEFGLEKFKTATRAVAEVARPVVSSDTAVLAEEAPVIEAEEPDAAPEDDEQPKKKRRRRRRRRKPTGEENGAEANGESQESGEEDASDEAAPSGDAPGEEGDAPATEEKPKRRRSRSRRKKTEEAPADTVAEGDAAEVAEEAPAQEAAPEAPEAEEKPKKRRRTRRKKADETPAADAAAPAEDVTEAQPEQADTSAPEAEPVAETPSEDVKAEEAAAPSAAEDAPAEPLHDPAPEPVVAEPDAGLAESPSPEAAEPAEPQPEEPAKPKRRGWWSLGR